MIRVFGVLIGFILCFVAGYLYNGYDQSDLNQLNKTIDQLQDENAELSRSNENINDTLALVKRQIQTDRVAYQALQETIASSEQNRELLQSQLLEQRHC